ncbi:MAG: dihydrodipicolinate synthase family protein [Trueperaceae bacterium]|nr:dihydrodipicolinate synthase family protein [Trueperaceae bacterium]
MMRLSGIYPALLTPFAADTSLRLDLIDDYVEFLLNAGVHGVHPGGTTGEAPLMTSRERIEVVERVVDVVNGRRPVIAQVGHIRTAEATMLARECRAVGADAVSIVTPYYYVLPEEALEAYFLAVIRALPDDTPIYLYNIPQSTLNVVGAPLLQRLRAAAPNVRGLKHSEANVGRLGAYLEDEGTDVFVGSDGLVLAGLAMGAVGAVSGNANVAPEAFVRLYDAWRTGRLDEARRQQRRIVHIASLLGNGGHLDAFKTALQRRGVDVGTVRDPLPRVREAMHDAIDEAVALATTS